MNPITILAFALKHWKSIALVVLLVGAGVEGYRLRAKQDALAQAQAQVRTLQTRLGTVLLQQKNDAARAATDKQMLEKLKQAIGETPYNPAACLDRAAVGRVRSIH